MERWLGGFDELTPETWQTLETLLDEALAHPEAERQAWLAARCGTDTPLRRAIDAWLEVHARTDGLVDRLARALDAGSSIPEPLDPRGTMVGPYRTVREVGRGGMGVVYLARREDGAYDRQVALKLIHGRVDERWRLERFLAERRILAGLAHPGIAQLFDGGVTVAGLPYFTMEWVDGTPITQYCDDHALDVAARLRLFTRACDAVAAAHRSLVVHRDLKPSHILVTRDGGVKLLDFGVAKLIDGAASSDVTQAAGVPFTPDYASPEHVSGGPITTATDVYSLGAVLYELLTGGLPHRFTTSSPVEIERSIRDRDPVRPSLAVAEGPGAARVHNRGRARHLAGDLDAIVLKALQKDPSRRYPSVDLLRQDIDHHLRGLPVLARPDHWTYRLRKLGTRHRAAALAALVIAGSLVAGLAGTLVQAGRVAAEREVARAEADRARRVTTLLADLFRLADPATTQGAVITAREVLDQGTHRVESELSGDPVTQAALLEAVGQVYLNLALLDSAEPLLERALALRTTGGASALEIAGVLHRLGLAKIARSEYGEAESRLREAVAMRRGPTSPAIDLAASLEALGDTVSELGRYDEAEALLTEAVELRREHDPRGWTILESLHSLAWTLHRKGDLDRAERLFREAVDQGRSLGDVVTPSRVRAVLDLARVVHRFDRSAQAALPLYREALDLARALHHSDHPQVALCLSEMAAGLRELGELAEAETMGRDARAMYRRLHGERHREVVVATQRLAGILAERGQRGEAEGLFREALASGRVLFGNQNRLVLSAMRGLASFLEADGRFDEALSLREEELGAAAREFGSDSAVTARALEGLGQHWQKRQQPARAAGLLRQAREMGQ